MNTIEQVSKSPFQPPHILLLVENVLACVAAGFRGRAVASQPDALHIYGRKNKNLGECKCTTGFPSDAKHDRIPLSALPDSLELACRIRDS